MGNIFAFGWEENFIIFLQSVLPASVISFINFLSIFGEEIICVLTLGFLYWCIDKNYAKRAGIGILMAIIFGTVLKNAVLRLRPYFSNEKIKFLRLVEKDADIFNVTAQGYSFPSMHSIISISVFGSLARFFKGKAGRIFAFIAVLIPVCVGFSRITVGAHYPTDVLAGFLIGAVCLFVFPVLQDYIKNRALYYGLLVLISLTGFVFCKSDDYYSAVGLIIGFVLTVPFEEKYVNFENTKSVPKCILRLAGGIVIFFALNILLKMPFSAEFLTNGSFCSHIVRTLRYAIIIFVELGLYPMLFKIKD